MIKRGKVRDIYDEGNTLTLVSTNRLSAFDRAICDIPCKGEVLNQLSAWWFKTTAAIINNHFLEMTAPNSMRVKKCRVLPIEVVVRGYITGSTNTSLWTLYQQGQRQFFNNNLPDNLQKNQPLPQPIITPTTKSDDHDKPLNYSDIKNINDLDEKIWLDIEKKSLELFNFSSQLVAKKGLILVDTKYEFGLDENQQLCLIDELHTPDSSRYWDYEDWLCAKSENREPQSFDKEIIRLWYRTQGNPYQMQDLPKPPVELIQKVSKRYQELYHRITGGHVQCVEYLEY